MNKLSFTVRSALVWLTIVAISGCSAPNAFTGSEYESIRKKTPLPYVLKVNQIHLKPDQGEPPLGVQPLAIADPNNHTELRESIKTALEKYRVFSAVILDQEENGLKPELQLTLTIFAPVRKDVGKIEHTGLIWPNLFLWLLAGVPAWFLEDTAIDQGVEISYSISYLETPSQEEKEAESTTPLPEILINRVDLSDAKTLNFVRRAGFWQYVLQTMIHPFLVPSNREVADDALYENYVWKLQTEIPPYLKENLQASLSAGSPPPPNRSDNPE